MKTSLITLALCAFGTAILAQPFAEAEYLTSTPFILNGAALIDLDGDGDLDAFSSGTGFNGSGIETWVNTNGTFDLKENNIPLSQTGTGVFGIGDIDADGDEDFATVISENFVWYANDGMGNFSPPSIIDTNVGDIRNIELVDIDGNPGLDLIVTRLTTDDVAAYANDGNGSFGSAVIVTTQSVDPIDVLAGDFDGDGLLDLAVACLNSCDVTWHKNLGGLNFGPQISLGIDQIGTYKLALGDFDENGHLDIASIGFGSDDVSVFFNSGAGNFGSRTIISTSVDGPVDLAVGDFNSDGHADLCVGTQEELYPIYFEGDGSGDFTQISLFETGSVSSSQQLLAGDVNGDGKMDIVTASSYDNKLALLEQKQGVIAPGAVPFFGQQLINKSAPGVSEIILADIDGDGLEDILSTERSSGRVTWYPNLSTGSFDQQEVLLFLDEGLSGLAADDMDGDGFLDLIVSNDGDSSVTLYLNQGDGSTFIPILIDDELDEPYSPFLSDLDNDGDQDIIVAVGWDAQVYIYPSNGDGSFGARITLCEYCLFSKMVSAKDLNGDGLPEVLVYVGQNQQIVMYENLGGLAFGESEVIIGSFNGARDVEYFDYDEDGDLDVFASAIYDSRINYAENLGGLNFAPEAEVPFNINQAHDLEIFDVDQDGDMDLLMTGGFSNSMLIIYMEDGEFIEKRKFATVYYNPTSLLSGDFNQDGKPDAIACFGNFVAFFSSQALTCAALRPSNTEAVVTATSVDFSWDPVPASAACRISVRDNMGEITERNIVGLEPSSFTAPLGYFNTGSGYNWRVRCACSLNPIVPTESSAWNSFYIPFQMNLFPNPAEDQLRIEFSDGETPSGQSFRIFDIMGRTMHEGIYTNQINLEGLESGYYLVEVDGRISKFFKK